MNVDRLTLWRRVGQGTLLVAALVIVALEALAMATAHFQPGLDSDQIYPHLLAVNVLDGVYPLSGWTLSSAPYFFPDFTLYTALLSLIGRDGQGLPWYVATYYVLLALACGAWLRANTGRRWGGWLAGAVFVALLLATRGVASHERFLWWLGSVGFHGGSVLLGLFFSAWCLGRATAAWSWRESIGFGLLALLGTASDTLFVVHWALPTLLALWFGPGRADTRLAAQRVTWTMLCAVLGWTVVRATFAAVGFLSFSKVFRYAPWPGAIFRSGGSLLHDLTHVLLAQGYLLVAGGAVAILGAIWLARRGGWSRFDLGALFVVSATLAIPVISCYWKNDHHARYILPCLVMPGCWLVGAAMRSVAPRRGLAAVATAGGMVILGFCAWPAAGQIDPLRWRWPTGDDYTKLETYLHARGVADGYADYWNVHRFNVVARTAVRLHPLRPDGRVQFWNDNAFWHYRVGSDGRLHPVKETFIVVDRLDAAQLRQKFGEPAEVVTVAGHSIWLYDANGLDRLNREPHREIDERVQRLLGAAAISFGAD